MIETSQRKPERLWTPQEVADYLGASKDWVYDHVNRRDPRLRAVRLSLNTGPGRTMIRFRLEDVEDFIELLVDPPQKKAS
jgi:excisionase family DNA binding protein